MTKLLLLALLLVAACEQPPPPTWTGVPDGERVCTWPEHRGATGTCVVGGVAYACVYDSSHRRVACARTSPLWTPESGR